MTLISAINDLSRRRRLGDYIFLKKSKVEADQIRNRLDTIKQTVQVSSRHTTIDGNEVKQTAELYRLGALLYLQLEIYRPCPQDPRDLFNLEEEFLKLLNNMSQWTSPWPIFLAGLGCQDEDQRAEVLSIIELMEARRIDNITYMRRIIEKYWRVKDLQGLREEDGILDWRILVQNGPFLPSFI